MFLQVSRTFQMTSVCQQCALLEHEGAESMLGVSALCGRALPWRARELVRSRILKPVQGAARRVRPATVSGRAAAGDGCHHWKPCGHQSTRG
eukprot:scaffold2640_cov376-Prasinococcus_capsulatus_cf.AAC.15